MKPENLQEPVPKEVPKENSVHGHTWVDEYAWMKDDKWQQVLREPEILQKDIRDHLEEENAYMKAVMAPTEKLQSAIQKEMVARLQQDESGVPSLDGPYAYFRRYEEGNEHPLFCRISREDFEGVWSQDSPLPPSQELLLDANALAANLTFFNLGASDHSPDHKLFAYATDKKGSEYYTIEILDLKDKTLLSDSLVNCSGSFAWSSDSQNIFYTMLDESHREKWVYRHKLGTKQEEDVLIYEEADDGFFVGVDVTDSQRFITIESSDHGTSEVRLVPADAPETPPILVQAREEGVQYDVQDYGESLLILTNKDGAVDFKVMTAPISSPGAEHWQELIAHRPGVLLKSLSTLKGYLVRSERVNALPRIVVATCDTTEQGTVTLGAEDVISFEEQAFSLNLRRGYEFNSPSLRFVYSSPTTPESCFDYDLSTQKRTLRKVQKVPSGHEPSDYVCLRKTATSPDGAKVPVTIMYKKGTPLDGSAPLLLYGYGSYGMSMPAGFSTTRLSLVDRGVVYAIAHVRGGTDCGYAWYDPAGKTMQKKNTFIDFVASAEFLVKEGFTSEGKIAILGRSAGGMLVGSTMNLAPKGLLAAVVGEVPFIDVLNTMMDTSLPLTPPEWPEWGNPIESKEAFEYIQSYAPYEQIEAKDYPHLLATGGLTDPRVTYWEPAKWVAKVRKLRTNKDALTLLKTDMGAGHAGKSGRFVQLEDEAFIQSFLLMVFAKIGALPPLDDL